MFREIKYMIRCIIFAKEYFTCLRVLFGQSFKDCVYIIDNILGCSTIREDFVGIFGSHLLCEETNKVPAVLYIVDKDLFGVAACWHRWT